MQREIVRDNMTAEVVSISPDASLPEAHQVMKSNGIRRLPVVEDGRLLGIISLGDVLHAEPSDASTLSIWEVNALLAQLRVGELMSKSPVTVRDDANIAEAATLMLEKKIAGLPVLDADGKLSGIITESDIFRLVVRNWQ